MKAAGMNRNGHRDATSILLAFRHGLRAAELVTLRWDNVDLAHGKLHVNRVKSGSPSVHPLAGTEIRGLRRLKRESPESPFVFVSERGSPFTTAGFRKMVARLGVAAKFQFAVHPHMLRHACGYKLANQGVDTRSLQHYLGHRNITHTVRYSELSPDRFKDFLEGLTTRRGVPFAAPSVPAMLVLRFRNNLVVRSRLFEQPVKRLGNPKLADVRERRSNAVRALLRIARQFGISQSDVRKALASDETKR
jgi:hypothetical protein